MAEVASRGVVLRRRLPAPVTAYLRDYNLFDAERGIPVNTAVWNTVAVPAAAVSSTRLDVATVAQ